MWVRITRVKIDFDKMDEAKSKSQNEEPFHVERIWYCPSKGMVLKRILASENDYSIRISQIKKDFISTAPKYRIGYFGAKFKKSRRSPFVVSSIYPNSPADKIGLEPGDKIISYNGKKGGVL